MRVMLIVLSLNSRALALARTECNVSLKNAMQIALDKSICQMHKMQM